MKLRNALALLVIAVLALAAGWQFGIRSRPTGLVEVDAGTLVFPGLAPLLQQAVRIEILHQGKTLTIAQGNGKWGLADRGGFPVQQDKLRELLTGLTELRIAEARTADPAQYARLGVEDAQPPTSNSNLLRVLDKDGKPLAALIVGHRRVRTQGNVPETIYIRRPDEAQAWLAEGRLPVDADAALWFERDIANIDHAKIAGAVITRGPDTLTFAREAEKFALKTPAEHPPLDDYRVEDVARGLEMLTLTDVKPIAETPGEKLATAVLTTTEGMTITVAVFKAGSDIWLQIAADGTGSETLKAKTAGWAYQVGAWKEKAFAPVLEDLKAAEPAPPPTQPSAPTQPPAP